MRTKAECFVFDTSYQGSVPLHQKNPAVTLHLSQWNRHILASAAVAFALVGGNFGDDLSHGVPIPKFSCFSATMVPMERNRKLLTMAAHMEQDVLRHVIVVDLPLHLAFKHRPHLVDDAVGNSLHEVTEA